MIIVLYIWTRHFRTENVKLQLILPVSEITSRLQFWWISMSLLRFQIIDYKNIMTVTKTILGRPPIYITLYDPEFFNQRESLLIEMLLPHCISQLLTRARQNFIGFDFLWRSKLEGSVCESKFRLVRLAFDSGSY